MKTLPVKRKSRESGSIMVEAMLYLVLFWTPLFLGTYQIGFSMIRAVQVTQICRDAAHLYSQQSANFDQSRYQTLITSLMPSNFTLTSTGNSVINFSTVSYVDDNTWKGAGLSSSANCPNYHTIVFTQQFAFGNSSLRSSNFGTVSSSSKDSSGNVSQYYQCTDASAVATNFSSVIPLSSSSEWAYVAEMYVNSTDLSFWSFLGTSGEYARSIF